MSKVVALDMRREVQQEMLVCVEVPDNLSHTQMKGAIDAVVAAFVSRQVVWHADSSHHPEYWVHSEPTAIAARPDATVRLSCVIEDGVWRVRKRPEKEGTK